MSLPLTIRLKRSPAAAIVLLLVHGLAGISLWCIESPLWLKGLLAAALVVSVFVTLRIHALRLGRGAVLGITLREDGELELAYAGGHRTAARAAADSTAFSWLLVLMLDSTGKRLALPLLADAVGKDEFRQLQLWLRWQCEKAQESAAPVNANDGGAGG